MVCGSVRVACVVGWWVGWVVGRRGCGWLVRCRFGQGWVHGRIDGLDGGVGCGWIDGGHTYVFLGGCGVVGG